MMKTAGQLKAWVRAPPSRTPAEPPMPPIAAQRPRARLRSTPSLKEPVTIARLAAEITAAPKPWIARAPIRTPWPSASAQPSEATAKSPTPTRKTWRRGRRSVARPASIRKPAKVSV